MRGRVGKYCSKCGRKCENAKHPARSWFYVVDVPSQDSRRKQEMKGGFARRADAEEALGNLLEDARDGSYVRPSKTTVGEYLNGWVESLSSKLEPTTIENYRVNVSKYIVPRLGGVRLQALDPKRIDQFYNLLLTSGRRDGGALKPKTVRNVHLVLHKALSTAVKWGEITSNPADACELVPRQAGMRQRQRALTVWSEEGLRSFLGHVRGDRLYALWLLLATTGMRRAEVLGLRWEDIDLETGRLAVRQSLTIVGHQPHVKRPKSDHGTRDMALDPGTIAAIREYRRRRLEERLAWGAEWTDTGLVFARENGTMIHPERLSDRFRQHVKAAGLPEIRLHDVRHSYATAALKAGVPAKVVSQRLGHAGIGITLDLYSHVLEDTDQDAADRVAALILGS